MRKIKKLIVAVMAMAMMLGMLTVSASAAVEDSGELYIAGEFNDWKHEKMESKGNGVYEITLTMPKDGELQYKFTNGEWPPSGIEINTNGDSKTGGAFKTPAVKTGDKVKFTIDVTKTTDSSDSAIHFGVEEGAVTAVIVTNDQGAGVSTPVIAVSVVAVIALAGVAICMKKRAVTE